ncbi:MAG: alanine--glyoxylate aminotransferase family protein [Elusimicrobiota bacterium]
MIKKYLLTPGPTPVPPEVLSAEGQPILHHRTSEFSAIFEKAKEGLKKIFVTDNDVLIIASSGTGAMEAAVINLLSPGDKVLVLDTGVFGQRWAQIIKAYGIEPIVIVEKWGNAVDINKVKDRLEKTPGIKAIFSTLIETSTGVVNDIKALAGLVKDKETLLVVDAISGLGGQVMKTKEWGVDVVVTGSQKGFMLAPGLAFISLNEKAWKAVESSKLPKYYFDLKKYKKKLADNETPFTPPVSLVVALTKALEMMLEEGIENIWARHQRLARGARAGFKAMGLELFASNPCDVVTSVKVPEGIEGGKIVKKLRQEYGVSIAGGQLDLKGKIFRMAHLGYMERFDLIIGISALEMALTELGVKIVLGSGVLLLKKNY